ncbi:MAG: FMN-binding negative transcriptional regulator [Methylovirgula sp.]
MYQPVHHREDRLDVQHDLIRAHPLGMLVTLGSEGLVANPIPFILDRAAAPMGALRAHVARANPFWSDFDAKLDALIVFQGPQIYISPNYYASKKETGKVVPTWNYVTVHAYGKIKVIDDKDWLLAQLRSLTAEQEADQARPWSVDDAPEEYIAMMLKGIVGIEIEISRIEGKWKVSQNRTAADRASVVAALSAAKDEDSHAIAALIKTDDKTS